MGCVRPPRHAVPATVVTARTTPVIARIVAGGGHHRHALRQRQPAVKVQATLAEDAYVGHDFAFRGRRGDLIKLLWSDDDGMSLLTQRLERGRFI